MEICLKELGGKIISAKRFLGQKALQKEDMDDNIFVFSPFRYRLELLKQLFKKSKEPVLIFEEEPSFFKRAIFNCTRKDIYIYMYRKPFAKYISHIKKYKKVKKIFVELDSHKEILVQSGIPKEKVIVCPTPAKVSRKTNEKKYDPENIKLVFASWNNTDKIDTTQIRGLFYIVDCMAKYKNISLDIVLRDNKTQIFENYAIKNNVRDRIKFFDISDTKDLEKVFDSADFVIYLLRTQIVKDVPNSLIDGLSRGKPIFMTDVLSFYQTVEKENIGIILKPDCQPIDFKVSKQDYKIMSENAYTFSKMHTSEEYAKTIKKGIIEINNENSNS